MPYKWLKSPPPARPGSPGKVVIIYRVFEKRNTNELFSEHFHGFYRAVAVLS